MEIEKKFLVKTLPDNLSSYVFYEMEQGYLLSANPTIRIRKKNDTYILTYKNRSKNICLEPGLCIAEEAEFPLTKEGYEHLRKKTDGLLIKKTRYIIPYNSHRIELDIFHGAYEGFCLAEVEFETPEQGIQFIPPAWFGKDVSNDIRYTNSYMSANEGFSKIIEK